VITKNISAKLLAWISPATLCVTVGVAHVFKIRPAQAIITAYGPAWQLPSAIQGGRLFKFGAHIDC
jgi:hypothetical protein